MLTGIAKSLRVGKAQTRIGIAPGLESIHCSSYVRSDLLCRNVWEKKSSRKLGRSRSRAGSY